MTAPIASGGSDFAGWGLHPLESAALSRRTPIADLPAVLFDHLVGAGEQQWRDDDAKRLCGFQVYNQLEFVRLGDWQTGNLNAVKDLSNVHASFAIECREAWSVADQAP